MRDSWTCERDIGAIGASEPFKVCTEVQTFIRCCAAQHARVWSISARLHAEFRSITNKAGEGIRTELFEVRIPVAVRRTAALTSRSEGRESATSEGREAKPSVPERKAGEGIRTLDIRHGRPVRTRQSFENALCSDPNAVQHTIAVSFVPLNS